MSPSKRSSWWLMILAGFAQATAATLFAAAEPTSPAPLIGPATIKVSGVGLWRDRELQRSLGLLLDSQLGSVLDGNATEDAAVMLLAALGEEGFQNPTIEIEVRLVDGTVRKFPFDTSLATGLPRPLQSRAVTFHVKPGVRWHITALEITGLTVLPVKTARSLFRQESAWLVLAKTNAYSPAHLENSVRALLGELRQRGYADAKVDADVFHVDEKNGAVTLHVVVREGAKWSIAALRYESAKAPTVTLPPAAEWIGQPWSAELRENLKESIRRACYQNGNPDVAMRISVEPGPVQNNQIPVTLVTQVEPGPLVTIGQVRFVGNAITRETVLRRAAPMESGAPFNPLALANARYRISRLGVFDWVELSSVPADGAVRDPVFTLKESQRTEANLMIGYGSYEQLRGGIELRQLNLFGCAHQSRLQLVQSMKSTSGDYTYSVPEIFGESIDGAARLFALQRQEVAFLRQEYGVSLSLKRSVPWLHAEGTLGYTFQVLRNRNNELATAAADETQVNVGSVTVGLNSDHRDNPLRPRDGYRWFTRLEHAARNLGGSTDFQRLELGVAWHTRWGESRWLHFGLTHGVITTFGTTDVLLPVNKRFFPGGDNSIRGYQDGEAAPRGADGLFIGAKSYLLFNFELEQALTSNWSLVTFVDALGEAAQLRDYPFAEKLYTAGLGVRYQTLIGPVRIEYGRNLNPRPLDPGGTWQISIGYPF